VQGDKFSGLIHIFPIKYKLYCLRSLRGEETGVLAFRPATVITNFTGNILTIIQLYFTRKNVTHDIFFKQVDTFPRSMLRRFAYVFE
jgi:hypothetical protein